MPFLPGNLYVDQPLSRAAVAGMQKADSFVAMMAFPRLIVDKPFDWDSMPAAPGSVGDAQQAAFDIDPKYRLEVQPGWANVMPWDYHESVSGWMDRHDSLLENIVPSDPDERS